MRVDKAIKNLVTLRTKFTGETHQQALQAVRDLRLSIRHQLIPSANDLTQRALETVVLLALRDTHMEYDEYQAVPESPELTHRVIQRVRPVPENLVVEVVPFAASRFMAAFVPKVTEDGSWSCGVPGIRMYRSAEGVTLRLLDADGGMTSANVLLRGVHNRAWRQFCRRVDEDADVMADPRRHSGAKPDRREADAIASHRSHLTAVSLGSSLLRRFGLVRDSFYVDTWEMGGVLNVEIHRGPTPFSVFQALQHPLAGMIRGQVRHDPVDGYPTTASSSFIRIVDRASNMYTDRDVAVGPPKLAVRR